MLVLCKVNDKIVSQYFYFFNRVRPTKAKKYKITVLLLLLQLSLQKTNILNMNYVFIQKPCNCTRRPDIYDGAFDFEFTW